MVEQRYQESQSTKRYHRFYDFDGIQTLARFRYLIDRDTIEYYMVNELSRPLEHTENSSFCQNWPSFIVDFFCSSTSHVSFWFLFLSFALRWSWNSNRRQPQAILYYGYRPHWFVYFLLRILLLLPFARSVAPATSTRTSTVYDYTVPLISTYIIA